MPYRAEKRTKIGDRVYWPGDEVPDDVDQAARLVRLGHLVDVNAPRTVAEAMQMAARNPEMERRVAELEEQMDDLRRDLAKHTLNVQKKQAEAAEVQAEADSKRNALNLKAAELLDAQRAADGPPSIPAPMVRHPGMAPELDQRPATPEQVALHEERLKLDRPGTQADDEAAVRDRADTSNTDQTRTPPVEPTNEARTRRKF